MKISNPYIERGRELIFYFYCISALYSLHLLAPSMTVATIFLLVVTAKQTGDMICTNPRNGVGMDQLAGKCKIYLNVYI